MYILTPKMYLLAHEMDKSLPTFVPFFSESVVTITYMSLPFTALLSSKKSTGCTCIEPDGVKMAIVLVSYYWRLLCGAVTSALCGTFINSVLVSRFTRLSASGQNRK